MERNKIIEKVKQWHKTRGITTKGNPMTQYVKLCEEVEEYFNSINNNNLQEIQDAVGDMQVVIIAIAELCKVEIDYTVLDPNEEYADENNYSINLIMHNLLNLASPLLRQDSIHIKKQLEALIKNFNSCFMYNSYKCLELAYNEIKDRYGLLLDNGNFIKGIELKVTNIDVRLFGTFVNLRAGNLKIQIEVGLPATEKYTIQSNYIPENMKPKNWQEFMEQAPDNLIVGDYDVY